MKLLHRDPSTDTAAAGPYPRILVVDDEPAVLTMLSEWLTSAGYRVDTALSAQHGLDLFHANKPDLAIIDILLPQMDGLELCRTIREVSPIPVVIITAVDDVAHKMKAFELGANDYLTKPATQEDLLGRVRTFLRYFGADQSSSGESAA